MRPRRLPTGGIGVARVRPNYTGEPGVPTAALHREVERQEIVEMSGMMMHGLGDCTPERNCGCMAKLPDDLRERAAQALWYFNHTVTWVNIGPGLQGEYLARADAVIAALGLTERRARVYRDGTPGTSRYFATDYEPFEELRHDV